MIVLIGPVLFILLILFAIRQQKRGLAGWKTALLVVAGTGVIAVMSFGLLIIGFRNFG
ncbi:hypothetical protein [Bradyrhizobium canariense]|uniref:hypothetical protein n=1 Tax=Bradyrhizobium canariense TaxID=255045 RepID=UPI001B8A1C6B|nr:hypothetical protein [Bradyrhizobium canariense]MBR0949444.1 hypothetical protein [Bradyrhizobium canariense]